jgi:CRISPR-associated protein Cas1
MPAADRVLDFTQSPAYLSVRNEQLVIQAKDTPTLTVPIAEIAVVLLSGPAVTLTQPVLAALLAANACVVVAGDNHLPAGMLLPISSHTLSTQRLREQIGMSQPRRKRLWQSIVIAKIQAQAAVLQEHGADAAAVGRLARRVRSGDPDNVEATAAQRYWPLLFGPDFRRRTDAADSNRLLNYGYAVVRAAVARSICAAGLHPSLGLHHRSRSNPFCLADDLMEPYRPLIDSEVRRIVGEWGHDVCLMPAIKQRLVEVVHRRIEHNGQWRDPCEWFDRTAQSLVAADGLRRVFYPNGIFREAVG